jgi:hypothetical protein
MDDQECHSADAKDSRNRVARVVCVSEGTGDQPVSVLGIQASKVTQASYIKKVRSDVTAAMQELERMLDGQTAVLALEKERVN